MKKYQFLYSATLREIDQITELVYEKSVTSHDII